MKKLALMTKQELVAHAHLLVKQEHQLALQLIECLSECQRRMLYADHGYSSLWSFAVEYLNLSEGSAQRYISAMRLSVEVPAVKSSLEKGSLSLSNASQLQTFFRNEVKNGNRPSLEEKTEIIQKMEGLSKKACEKELLKLAPKSVTPEKQRPLTDNLTELRFVVPEAVMKKLEILKGLLAHKLPEGSLSEIFEFMVSEELKRQLKKKAGVDLSPDGTEEPKKAQVPKEAQELKAGQETISPPPAIVAKNRKVIPVATRRKIWLRAGGRCEYVSQEGKRCDSIAKVEFDHHFVPVAHGGGNDESNILLKCRTHNCARAVEVFSAKHMANWLPNLR